MTPEEMEYVKAGLTAYVKGQEPVVDVEALGPKIAELARTRMRARAEKEREKSKPFLEAAAKEPGAVRTESGLIFQSLREGTGAQPTATDMVKVNYRVTLPDGKEVESSSKLNEPSLLPLNGIVQCWNEGVQKMKVGGKARLVCPSNLVYGDRGTPNIPGGSAVVYEVELVDVQKNAAAPMPGHPGPHGGHGPGGHEHGGHEHGQQDHPAQPSPPAKG
jgi:FKBP-type peptidyl-prolyl cis-trans isomerase FkpA